MLTTISTSQRPRKGSQDLLTHQSEQIILSITKFLDLKSLENLQLTNRRIRQLYLSSLWKNLFIVTFRAPHPPLGSLSFQEIFRRKYFEKNPQELIQHHEMLRIKRLEEKQRQEVLERVIQMRLEADMKRRHEEIEKNITAYWRFQRKEVKVVGWSAVLLCLITFFAWFGFSYDGNDCSEKQKECYDLSQKVWSFIAVAPMILMISFFYLHHYKDSFKILETRQEIAKQAWKTLPKIIFLILSTGVDIGAIFIMNNSSCSSYQSETCPIAKNYSWVTYLLSSLILLFLLLRYFIVLYMELKTRWITPISRPLLACKH